MTHLAPSGESYVSYYEASLYGKQSEKKGLAGRSPRAKDAKALKLEEGGR